MWEYSPYVTVATPTFSVAAGTYIAAQSVTINDATANSTIYYTTDGSTPTTSSSSCTSCSITVSSTETLSAIAMAPGYSLSVMATAAYTITIPNNPVPVIGNTSPTFTDAGGAAFTLTVNGSGFAASSTVYWGASALTTTFVSTTQLAASVTAAEITSAGTTAITVQAPIPGGGTSNPWQFEVDSASGTSSAPTFTSTSATVAAGATAIPLGDPVPTTGAFVQPTILTNIRKDNPAYDQADFATALTS